VGLLHPVVVTEGMVLVAGDRRLAAVRHLGWTDLPVTILDLETVADVLRAEADENTCRKPLTPYEAARARERRATVFAEEAKQRQRQHGGTAPGRPADTSSNLDEVSPTQPAAAHTTRKLGAIGTGYSGSTLDKVDRIRDVAERGVVRQGKTETPVPEPAREVAREALAEIQQTGAAVDRAARNVEAALATFIDENPDVKAARLRKAVWQAIRAAEGLPSLSVEHVAAICDEDMTAALAHTRDRITDWVGEVEQATPKGLRLVGEG
jgi:ParB family chromosome partitioning protein